MDALSASTSRSKIGVSSSDASRQPSWQRGYARRSALERINNRIDNSFCFEKHFIRVRPK